MKFLNYVWLNIWWQYSNTYQLSLLSIYLWSFVEKLICHDLLLCLLKHEQFPIQGIQEHLFQYKWCDFIFRKKKKKNNVILSIFYWFYPLFIVLVITLIDCLWFICTFYDCLLLYMTYLPLLNYIITYVWCITYFTHIHFCI